MPVKKEGMGGFLWGLGIGILGCLLFPSYRESLKELGASLVKEALEIAEKGEGKQKEDNVS